MFFELLSITPAYRDSLTPDLGLNTYINLFVNARYVYYTRCVLQVRFFQRPNKMPVHPIIPMHHSDLLVTLVASSTTPHIPKMPPKAVPR
jgi:hypothetical protein